MSIRDDDLPTITPPPEPKKLPRPRRLICCCCGASVIGRQWWNRDTGYGICEPCAESWANNPRAGGPGELIHACGPRGVYWGLEDNGEP